MLYMLPVKRIENWATDMVVRMGRRVVPRLEAY